MGLTVTINGGDVSPLVDVSSLIITQVLTRRGDTAQFDVLDPTRTLTFAPFDQVAISDEAGNRKFAGVVTQLQQWVSDGPGINRWRFSTCQDWTYYLQKTLCNKKYQQQTIDQIVKDLLASFPPGIAITTSHVQTPLPALQYFNADHLRLSDAFDKLVRNSDVTSFLMWDVDAAKDLHFFDQDHVPTADVILTDAAPTGSGYANYRRDTFSYQRDASQLANQITFRGGTFLSVPHAQTWIGNGVQTSYVFDYQPDTSSQAGGYIPTVTVGGAAVTVGLDEGSGFGTDDALVSIDQATQVASLHFAAAPSTGAVVMATYVYDVPVLVRRKQNDSVVSYGTWEEYVVDSSVITLQAATQRAAAMLSQFAAPLATAQLDVDRRYIGALGAGQLVQLINTQLGLDTQMIVTDCRITGQPGGGYAYQLQMAAFG